MKRAEHLTENEISGYLDDDLSAGERSRVEHHMESCAECRTAMVEVMRAADSVSVRVTADAPHNRSRWVAVLGFAAAAVLVAVIAFPRNPPTPIADAQRSVQPVTAVETRRAIAALSPAEGATIARDRLTFVWQSAGADLYRLTVTTDSGEPVWRSETADTSIAMPASVALLRGTTYYWSVEGVNEGITASTGAHAFKTP